MKKDIRKFWVTECEVCGGYSGVIEDIKSYSAKRDIFEWEKEGREVKTFIQKKGQKIPFCTCPEEDEEA